MAINTLIKAKYDEKVKCGTVGLKSLIKDYYHNYAIFIGSGNYSTEPILARKRVLRGETRYF